MGPSAVARRGREPAEAADAEAQTTHGMLTTTREWRRRSSVVGLPVPAGCGGVFRAGAEKTVDDEARSGGRDQGFESRGAAPLKAFRKTAQSCRLSGRRRHLRPNVSMEHSAALGLWRDVVRFVPATPPPHDACRCGDAADSCCDPRPRRTLLLAPTQTKTFTRPPRLSPSTSATTTHISSSASDQGVIPIYPLPERSVARRRHT